MNARCICLQVMLRQAVKNSPTREGITPPSKRNHQKANMEGVGSLLFFFFVVGRFCVFGLAVIGREPGFVGFHFRDT